MKAWMWTLLMVGCAEKDPEADWDTGSSEAGSGVVGAGSDEPAPAATFNLGWTSGGNALQVSVSNPHSDGYFLGLVETGVGAQGWYGEDCVSDDAICHDMGASSSVTLDTVHPDYGGGGIDQVVAGRTTFFHPGLWAGVTYVFFSNEGGTGYETLAHVGGEDTSYYE